MFVKSMNEAWCAAKKIFPTDYKLDEMASKNAGYEIYYSTAEGNSEWISNLGTALELNMKSGTIRINVIEDKPVLMVATVRSLSKGFDTYTIRNIVSVQYVGQRIVLTAMKDGDVYTQIYNNSDTVVEVNAC